MNKNYPYSYEMIVQVKEKTYSKTISSPDSISKIMEQLVLYVQLEGINELGECNLKVNYKF